MLTHSPIMVGYHEEREQTAEINERRKRTIEEIVLENKCDINPFYGLKGKVCPFNLSTEMCRNCWNIIRRYTGDCSVRSHAQQQPLSASRALVKKGSIEHRQTDAHRYDCMLLCVIGSAASGSLYLLTSSAIWLGVPQILSW